MKSQNKQNRPFKLKRNTLFKERRMRNKIISRTLKCSRHPKLNAIKNLQKNMVGNQCGLEKQGLIKI